MAQLQFDVVEMHKPKIQLCEVEGVDVIIKNPSDAVCINQPWGNGLLTFGSQRHVHPSLRSRDQ